MILEEINKRYKKETSQTSMGCANLNPFLNIRKGDSILDLGCGRGYQVFEMAKQTGERGEVTGFDLTQKMIDIATKNNSFSNVSFIQGNIEKLPFEENRFDLITSNCVINHSQNKKLVFEEIFRTLKNKGRFLIGDVMSVEELPADVANDPKAIAQCYGGAIPKDKYLKIVIEIGFKNIRILSSRVYPKNGFILESILLTGEKHEVYH